MKKVLWAFVVTIVFSGCAQNAPKAEKDATQISLELISRNDVVVYYFHGKQRCKTCVAVGDVAEQTVEKEYANIENVTFIVINTIEKGFEKLIEKYDVTWNALIIAKGEDFIEITDQAFATAVKNPQSLENLIKEEVNKRLQ